LELENTIGINESIVAPYISWLLPFGIVLVASCLQARNAGDEEDQQGDDDQEDDGDELSSSNSTSDEDNDDDDNADDPPVATVRCSQS
jgi:hypothetical protein